MLRAAVSENWPKHVVSGRPVPAQTQGSLPLLYAPAQLCVLGISSVFKLPKFWILLP